MDKWLIKAPQQQSDDEIQVGIPLPASAVPAPSTSYKPKRTIHQKKTVPKKESLTSDNNNNSTSSDISDQDESQEEYEDSDSDSPIQKKKLVIAAPRATLKRKIHSQYLFSDSWLDIKEFKGWLAKSQIKNRKGDDFAYCKACKINILAQKSCLKRHRTTIKHVSNWQQVSENTKITDIYKTTVLDENIRIAEIKLCGLLACNNLPFALMDTLDDLCGQIFPDSQIARKLSIKRTKATALVNECLGKIFLRNLYHTLQKNGSFFSLIMDETTDVSAKKQCAFAIIHFDNDFNKPTKHNRVTVMFYEHFFRNLQCSWNVPKYHYAHSKNVLGIDYSPPFHMIWK